MALDEDNMANPDVMMNEIVYDILGEDHPVCNAIRDNKPVLVQYIIASILQVVMTELQSIEVRLCNLEDKYGD